MMDGTWAVVAVGGPHGQDADSRAYRAIREEVFVVEQRCPLDEEWDAHDDGSHHLLGVLDGRPVATARWRPVEREGIPMAKLERFAVIESARGRGIGRRMVMATLDAARRAGHQRFVLHAQAHLEGLYASFGFRSVGGVFEEAGIPHVLMVRP